MSRYCECYQGSIICSNKCKCVECLNTNMSIFRNGGGSSSGASLSSVCNSLFKNGSSGVNNTNGVQASSSSSSSSSAFMAQALTHSANQENPIDSNENSNLSNLNKQSNGENTDSCLPTQSFFSQLSFSRQSSQSTFAAAAAASSANSDEDTNAFPAKTKLCTSTSSGDHALQVSNNFDKLISNASQLAQRKGANSETTNPNQSTGTLRSNEQTYTGALSLPTIKRVRILISHSCTSISMLLNKCHSCVISRRSVTICYPT